jgi:hypothetical protein
MASPVRARAPGPRPAPAGWAAGWRIGSIGCSKTATTGASPGKRIRPPPWHPPQPPPWRPPQPLPPQPLHRAAAAWRPSPAGLPAPRLPAPRLPAPRLRRLPRRLPRRRPASPHQLPPPERTGRMTPASRCPAGSARHRRRSTIAPLPLPLPLLRPLRPAPVGPCPAPPAAAPEGPRHPGEPSAYGGWSAAGRLASLSR